MRKPIFQVVDEIQLPTHEDRESALAAGGTNEAASAHERYLEEWAALTSLEVAQPVSTCASGAVSVGAWNVERCKRIEESADLIQAQQIQILLATELDYGMARSGQHHTTRDLAARLDMGYIFGVEFVELGIGDFVETKLFSGQENLGGLHGNAILSRFPMNNPTLIPIDDGGLWYTSSPKGDGQLRVGGRMAIAAQIEFDRRKVIVVSVHFESESGPDGRVKQAERLLSSIDEIYGTGPCIIGGDFNTVALTGLSSAEAFAGHVSEPCFSAFRDFGYTWADANTGKATNRAPLGKDVRYPLMRLDWLFFRGLQALAPKTTAALSDRLEYLSDHELIHAEFDLH